MARFVVDDVFDVPGRGIVVDMRVLEGPIPGVGQRIRFTQSGGSHVDATIAGTEMAGMLRTDRCSWLLRSVTKRDVPVGTIAVPVSDGA